MHEKVTFRREAEIQDNENSRDQSTAQMRIQTLSKENARAKCSMAEELKNMGFSDRAINRLLHTQKSLKPVEGDACEKTLKNGKVR